MAEDQPFTLEAVRLFMVEKGGLCTNHDLVARFKPYLNHAVRKLENRNKLKDFVQLLASVETRNGEKVLVLKKRYNEQGCFNMLANQEKSESQGSYQPSGGLVSIPEVFAPTEASPEPLPPVRPSRNARRDVSTPNTDVTSSMSGSSGMDFYSSRANPSQDRSVLPEPVPPPPADTRTAPVDMRTAPPSEYVVPPPEDYATPPVTFQLAPTNSDPSVEDAPVPPGDIDANSEAPSLGYDSSSDVPDAAVTPNRSSTDTMNKTPMSAKDRIKQFDQISDQSVAAPSQHSRRKQDNHSHRHFNNPDTEYDGGLTMVSLNSQEKEWMLLSSAGDYHTMNKLVKEQPDLAHRRDFINGYNAMHWAAKHGKPEIIKMLNGYQVDANLRSYCGYTPLHLAAMGGNEECISLLVNLCKVQTNVRDFYGKRPKQYLKKNCSTRIQQMLLNNARQSFTVGNTVDDMNAFARTQSFSAKIMKSTQGLARKFVRESRAYSEAADAPDSSRYSPEQYTRFSHNYDSNSQSQYGLASSDSGRGSLHSFNHIDNSSGIGSEDSYAMSRSESAPDFPPLDSDNPPTPGYTNILL